MTKIHQLYTARFLEYFELVPSMRVRKKGYTKISQYFISQYHIDIQHHYFLNTNIDGVGSFYFAFLILLY